MAKDLNEVVKALEELIKLWEKVWDRFTLSIIPRMIYIVSYTLATYLVYLVLKRNYDEVKELWREYSWLLKHADNRLPFFFIERSPLYMFLQLLPSIVYDLQRVIEEAERILCPFPSEYFKEGYGSRPKNASQFMFITRPVEEGRTQEAFLILEGEVGDKIIAKTSVGIQRFEFSKKPLSTISKDTCRLK